MRERNLAFLRKRRGSGLPLALIVVLIGSAVVAMMYQMSISFVWTTSQQRRPVADGIVAASFIEEAKGAIMASNDIAGSVLRGPKNATLVGFTNTNNDPITSSDQLLISPDHFQVDARFLGDVARRWVRVNVYDANYNPEKIATSGFDFQNLPPSFYIKKKPEAEPIGSSGGEYEEGAKTPTSEDKKLFDRYGAYLVRVEIYNVNEGGNAVGSPVRTTEEAFLHVLP